jgi:hypothetical protein
MVRNIRRFAPLHVSLRVQFLTLCRFSFLIRCLANYRTDPVLQQSATGTLHRLQTTLSSNKSLHARFTASLQAQHRVSKEHAHREAFMLREMEARLMAESSSASTISE